MVAPDIVVYRNLCSDEEINATEPIVNDTVCRYADLREKNGGKAILHASVSAKMDNEIGSSTKQSYGSIKSDS